MILLCAAFLMIGSILKVQASSGQQANESEEAITVGVPVDRCPVFYKDADSDEIMGIGVDLMRTAAEEAGFAVTFRSIWEETLKEALDNGEYDFVMPFGSAIDSASGHASIVTDNLFQTPFTIVTESGRNLPPLNELRVGMLDSLGGVVETIHQLYPGIEIAMYDDMSECVSALRSGSVDALLHNSYVWSYILQRPSYSNLAVYPSAMFSMDFRAGTLDNARGRALIDRLNEGIAGLTETRRQAIILDYTSRRLYRYDFFDYVYLYGMVILLGALLFISLIVILILRVRAYRLKQEEKIRRMIDYDSLTGALSLVGFRKRVEELLRTYPDTPYMLSYSNIRDFKYINESLGKDAGDELLRFWVEKCKKMQSEKEAFGRVSGDRIAALICMPGEEKIKKDEKEVLTPIRNYFTDRGRKNQVQISSGVYVLTPEDYRNIDVDRMLDFASMAEKRQRAVHKDGYVVYNPGLWDKGKRNADIITHLPLAVRSGEIQVWYQPQVDAKIKKITGMEALCRWNHAALGWISPAEFIPLLEENGLIFELDSFVWERVCQDLKRWNSQGQHRFVSVNLSRSDIRECKDIPGRFLDLIKKYSLTADQLRIEITETAFEEDPELLISTTEKLRRLGFQVEMDDFGSGYSSLHMLKEIPVDRIKLDLHFLTAGGDPEKARIIVTYIIKMVRALGLDLIAEGVENESQAEFLQNHCCTNMQGYYYYKPMAVNVIDNTDLLFA